MSLSGSYFATSGSGGGGGTGARAPLIPRFGGPTVQFGGTSVQFKNKIIV